jgi:hypothetical protein
MFPMHYNQLLPDPDERRQASRMDVQRWRLANEKFMYGDGLEAGEASSRSRVASIAHSVRRSLGAMLIATGERICPEPECDGIEAVRHA